jgi:hypothetical protein
LDDPGNAHLPVMPEHDKEFIFIRSKGWRKTLPWTNLKAKMRLSKR